MNSKIKVILVDDHAIVRAGFRLLLATSETIEMVAEADRGEQAIQLVENNVVDILVMDISMPGIGGLETIRRISERNKQVKILVFSVHDQQVYVGRALAAGAKGYITKNSAPEILIEAVHQLANGSSYVEKGLLKDSGQQSEADYQAIINQFSAREFDIYSLLAKGLNAYKIADELCLGYKTVANYSTQIKKKLQVATIAELAQISLTLNNFKK